MTPSEFVEEIRKMHEPYLPVVVEVMLTEYSTVKESEHQIGVWHKATIEEQAEAVEMWCDGCNCSANWCRVRHLLVLVEE